MISLYFDAITLRAMMTLKQPAPAANPDVIQQAHDSCIEAALRVSNACRSYMDQHRETPINVVTIQPCMLALLVFIEAYPTNQEYAADITTLSTFMRRQSRRWPLSLAYLRMVQLNAKSQTVTLPPDIDKLFEDFETQQWKVRERKRFVSMLPDPSKILSGDSTEVVGDMGKFIQQMEDLSLQIDETNVES